MFAPTFRIAEEYAYTMGQRLPRALVFGLLTFVVAYVLQMAVSIIWSTYHNGPIPDLVLGIPLPLLVSFVVGAVAFLQTSQ